MTLAEIQEREANKAAQQKFLQLAQLQANPPQVQREFDQVFDMVKDTVEDPNQGGHGGPASWGHPFR